MGNVIQFPLKFTSKPYFADFSPSEKEYMLNMLRAQNHNNQFDEQIRELELSIEFDNECREYGSND